MDPSPVRTAVLGGEVGGRGIFSGKRSRLENLVMYIGLFLGIVAWLILGGLIGIIFGALLFAVGFGITYELPSSGSSVFTLLVAKVYWWWRLQTGAVEFVPLGTLGQPQAGARQAGDIDVAEGESKGVPPALTEGGGGAAGRPRTQLAVAAPSTPLTKKDAVVGKSGKNVIPRIIPDGIGSIRLMSLDIPGGGSIAVLQHMNPYRTPFMTAVLEVEGQPSGLREESDFSNGAERFGRFLASCSGPSSLVDGIQIVTRVVPVDSAVHEWYILRNRSLIAPRRLFESYAELIGQARQTVEQHRNYIIAKIPLTSNFAEIAKSLGGTASDEEIRCRVVLEEMNRLALTASSAELKPLRVLGPRRLAGLLRSLQDPDYYIDDYEGVDLSTCWQPYQARRQYVLTNQKWATRTARVDGDALSTEPVHMRWLSPLILGVQPSVIRTTADACSPRRRTGS
jgi:hypothetical protein